MFEKTFEWAATAVLIVGVVMTSLNIFPQNLYISMLGNFMWFVLGIMWKKWSLIAIQITVTIIYVFGIYNHFYA